ncbi:ABC transporter ATP-binding protein/permease [Alphaproteobacteria bacterium]|nr:ABC transporter ATP-binding protein/permease [Alphaproteobacteria bacterium]
MINFFKRTYNILNKYEKLLSIYVFFLILISLFIELIGIGMIIPIIGILVNYETLIENKYINYIYFLLNQPSKESAILYSMSFLSFVYFIKVIFFIHLTERQAEFVKLVNRNMSKKLLNYYLYQPFLFFTEKHSAELIRNTIGEVDLFALALRDLITFILEVVIISGLLLFMFFYKPIAALFFIVALIFLGIVFNFFSKKKLQNFGEKRIEFDRFRLQNLQNLISGIRDVKIYQKENFFKEAFLENNKYLLSVRKTMNIITAVPKFLIEFVSIIVLTLIVIVLVFNGTPSDDIIITLGIFAAIGLRILPSLNRIYINAQSLSFSFPMFDNLYNEFYNRSNSNNNDTLETPKVFKKIIIKDLLFSYPGTSREVLKDLNIEIVNGQCIGIFGESGSGKSTLVDIITGLININKDQIFINDIDLSKISNSWKKNIGYVSQNLFLIDDTIEKNIAFGEENIDKDRLERAISGASLSNFVSSLDNQEKTHVGELGKKLSGGQRQRIGIARALYKDPQIIVFDEATSALDSLTENNIMKTIYGFKQTKTVLIISHKLNLLNECDKIYEISNSNTIQHK